MSKPKISISRALAIRIAKISIIMLVFGASFWVSVYIYTTMMFLNNPVTSNVEGNMSEFEKLDTARIAKLWEDINAKKAPEEDVVPSRNPFLTSGGALTPESDATARIEPPSEPQPNESPAVQPPPEQPTIEGGDELDTGTTTQ